MPSSPSSRTVSSTTGGMSDQPSLAGHLWLLWCAPDERSLPAVWIRAEEGGRDGAIGVRAWLRGDADYLRGYRQRLCLGWERQPRQRRDEGRRHPLRLLPNLDRFGDFGQPD